MISIYIILSFIIIYKYLLLSIYYYYIYNYILQKLYSAINQKKDDDLTYSIYKKMYTVPRVKKHKNLRKKFNIF